MRTNDLQRSPAEWKKEGEKKKNGGKNIKNNISGTKKVIEKRSVQYFSLSLRRISNHPKTKRTIL